MSEYGCSDKSEIDGGEQLDIRERLYNLPPRQEKDKWKALQEEADSY